MMAKYNCTSTEENLNNCSFNMGENVCHPSANVAVVCSKYKYNFEFVSDLIIVLQIMLMVKLMVIYDWLMVGKLMGDLNSHSVACGGQCVVKTLTSLRPMWHVNN